MRAIRRRAERRAVALAVCTIAAVAVAWSRPVAQAQPSGRDPRRIVSLIPATTEMLFEIGAGSRVVAVSSFDRYPSAVESLPRVGALLDPNVEAILALKPDLVIVYDTQVELKEQLTRAGTPMFRYVHRALPDIMETIRALGTRLGLAADAEKAVARIEARLAAVRARVANRLRPKTLLVIGREPGSLRRIDASGGYGFLHDLLEIAGGDDVLGDVKRQMVQLGTESVLARRPDVIIELHYGDEMNTLNVEAERSVWNTLAAVPAVRNRRVHLLGGDEFVVPGPRIALAAERFMAALHPDAR